MNSTFRFFAVLCALFQVQPALAQIAGSREAYNAIRDSQRLSIDQEISWRESEKITLLKQIPERPKENARCLDPQQLDEGRTGFLECWQYKVIQVIDGKNVIVGINNPDIPDIWIADYDTSNLVDGKQVRIVGPVKVGESKSFTTVLGAKRTLRVVRLTDEHVLDAIDVRELRSWNIDSGAQQIEARYVGYVRGKVQLETRSGEVQTVEMKQLAKPDREWVANRRKADEAAAKQAAAEEKARNARRPGKRGGN